MAPYEALIQIGTAAHDTLLMKQVVPERGLLEQIAAVAGVITTIALTAFAIVAVPAAWRFRKTYQKINNLLDRVYGDIVPIMRHASTISDNVNYITTALRTDVQKINATIASANERIQQAVEMTEERMNEFNALLAVVQQEAEQVFVATASTVRGVRTGAAAFRDRGGMDLASEEPDAADEADEIESQLASEEESDGYNGNPESSADALPAAPRLRPRTRSSRERA